MFSLWKSTLLDAYDLHIILSIYYASIKSFPWDFSSGQWLIYTSPEVGMGLIPSLGTKILYARQCGENK